jgi:hypothetical protein
MDITNPHFPVPGGPADRGEGDAYMPEPRTLGDVGADALFLPAQPPLLGREDEVVEEDELPHFKLAQRGGQVSVSTSTPSSSSRKEATVPRSLSQVSTAASLGADEARRGRAAVIDEVRKYAHTPADLAILSRFLDLQLLDGHHALAIDPPKGLLRLVLRAMKLLHLCDFQHEDVCCILAHTSVYFRSTYKACGHQMDTQEVSNAVVAQMFIAHSYIQDETCPLRVWHEHIFQKYCSVKTLNAVILRLIEIRAYRLRVDRREMMKRYKYLCGSSTHALRNGGLPTQHETGSEQTRSSGRSSHGSSPRDEPSNPEQQRETPPVTEAATA